MWAIYSLSFSQENCKTQEEIERFYKANKNKEIRLQKEFANDVNFSNEIRDKQKFNEYGYLDNQK